MINRLTIQNFQSHPLTDIELHHGVNVFIGQSDSGKTAIVRALDWAINNRPQGDDFRRVGGSDTSVEVVMDGCAVKRSKHKTTSNLYELDVTDPSTGKLQVLEFKAFGASVPEEVSRAVGMTDLNWQRQLDSPFLLSKSPGEVARTLNSIVKLDAIDSSLSRIASMKLSVSRELDIETVRKSELEAKVAEFGYLPEMERAVKYVEELDFGVGLKVAEVGEIATIVERVIGLSPVVARANKILRGAEKIEELRSLKGKLDSLSDEMETLFVTTRCIVDHQDTLGAAEHELKAAGRIRLLSDSAEVLFDLERELEKLEGLYQDVGAREISLEKTVSFIKHLESQMPEVCPTCGRPL